MKLGAVLATVLLISAVGGCGGSEPKKETTSPSRPKDEKSTPRDAAVTATCDLVGKQTAHVTLEETSEDFVLTFTGAPVGEVGTTGYFATVFDEPGDNGAQLGITFRDGEPESYFVFDSGAAHQTNLEGEATVAGKRVVGTFPKSSENLSDFEVARWNAALTRNGNDIAGCPDLDGGEFLQPFPG